jgi:hypothetical protein
MLEGRDTDVRDPWRIAELRFIASSRSNFGMTAELSLREVHASYVFVYLEIGDRSRCLKVKRSSCPLGTKATYMKATLAIAGCCVGNTVGGHDCSEARIECLLQPSASPMTRFVPTQSFAEKVNLEISGLATRTSW